MKTKLLSVLGLVLGLTGLFLTVPDFLLKLEIAIGSAAAIAYGYSACSPRAPAWLHSQPVRGMACIYGGVAALFVPVEFLISALLLGIGARLCMTSFDEPIKATVTHSDSRDIVVRQSGQVVKS